MIEKVRAMLYGLKRLQGAVFCELVHASLRQDPASTFTVAEIWLVINSCEDGISLQSPTNKAIHFVDLTNVAVFIEARLCRPFYH